jgi:hypothetical protein
MSVKDFKLEWGVNFLYPIFNCENILQTIKGGDFISMDILFRVEELRRFRYNNIWNEKLT